MSDIDFGNPLTNLVANPAQGKQPGTRKVLNAILDAMASNSGACWAPVAKVVEGKAVAWDLMLRQCPGACGHVWKLTLTDDAVCRWLVNELNHRKFSPKEAAE